MSGPIPVHIDPRKLVDRGIVLKGPVSSTKMTRLNALLESPAGDVQVELEFGRDEQRIPMMRGHYQVDATLICQRCLEPVVIPLDSQCAVGFVESDEAARSLPGHYEPVILDDESLDLVSLIEDELLLALPVVPTHPIGTCQHPPGFESDTAEPEDEAVKPNPFSVLAKLKRDT